MDIQQRGIIALFKSGITGARYDLPPAFDLEYAMQQCRRHHLEGLFYTGARNCGIPANDPAMTKAFARLCKQTLKSDAQLREVERVLGAFDNNRIDYLPLKGCKMKMLYPAPELRYMGDADILIRMEQYPLVVKVMEELCFERYNETDHELIWISKDLHLELHKRLIPSYNKDFYAYFGEGWHLARVEHGSCYTMSAEDELIFLFSHFAKHYRDGGIGCRHVVDLWVFRCAHPDMDECYVRSELQKLKLCEFYDNIIRLIGVWFEDEPTDEKVDYVSGFIFSSGDWGTMEKRILSAAVKDTNHADGRGGRLHYILRKLFPGANTLKKKYKVLERAPWLLPFVWGIRPFYKLLFERETLTKQKEALEVLEQDNIAKQKILLNYVGLDFNF